MNVLNIMAACNKYMILEAIITLIMLLFAVRNDLRTKKIKNVIPFSGIILGTLLSLFNGNNIKISLFVSFMYFFVLFFLPRFLSINDFLGAGDIKIYMAITMLMGYKVSIYTFTYSMGIACVCLLALNIKRIKTILTNILLFLRHRKVYSKVIESYEPSSISPYILAGFIPAYIQFIICANDWLFILLKK